jgi:hypothetical protein
MGASAWLYFTPWTDDADAALQRLRRETFEAGDYYGADDGSGGSALDGISQEDRDRIYRTMDPVRKFMGIKPWERAPWEFGPGEALPGEGWDQPARGGGGRPPPGTVDKAVARAGDEGTHSILDITHTAPFYAARAAAPLPEFALRRHLGTTRPDHEQVEDRFGDVAEALDRWECVYLTVYREGEPHELAFIGVTGD